MSSTKLYLGDRLELAKQLKEEGIKANLIVTSPPYNMGKEYESNGTLSSWLFEQRKTIMTYYDILSDTGSMCWQVGNYVEGTGKNREIFPLDMLLYPIFSSLGLKLKNRIVWTFGHGLHNKHTFSGRHETILWFVKSDNYTFNLDSIRVPQKYPNKKHYKGTKVGQLSGNPLGKNPGDVWDITNVKYNHPEKTDHPCQFPLELVERLVLSLTKQDDWVVDPYIGSGTTAVAAIKHNRNAAGSDIKSEYLGIAHKRLEEFI